MAVQSKAVNQRLHRIKMTRSLRQSFLCALLALGLQTSAHAQGPKKCVSTVVELKQLLNDQAFSLNWQETTMDDGRPLLVTIFEKDGALSVEFVKSTKGLWARIDGDVCKADKDFEIRFTGEQIHFGPAASWVLRYVLGNGGAFKMTRISAKQLRVATSGWDGMFAPVEN
jgi:hypothetical protein